MGQWAFCGSVAIFSDLKSLYEKIRSSEPVILGYIGMNALILVLFGIYLLSRTVVRPINRLVAMTEKFDGAIPIMQKNESPNNEIGRLSQSLNHMLRELDANERKLKENISSLEAANQEIKRAQDEMVESEKWPRWDVWPPVWPTRSGTPWALSWAISSCYKGEISPVRAKGFPCQNGIRD